MALIVPSDASRLYSNLRGVAGLRLVPGFSFDTSAIHSWITQGVEIFGPIFIVLRGWLWDATPLQAELYRTP